MSNVTLCRYFYAGPPECERTYADNVGAPYYNYEKAYIVITVLITTVVWGATAQLIYRKKAFFPLDLQRKILYYCSLGCLWLIIRTPDPQGWRRVLPSVVMGMLTDAGAATVYSSVILIVVDWVRIILKVSGKGHQITQLTTLGTVLQIIMWLVFVTCGGLQNGVDPLWAWRVLKFSVGIAVLLTLQVLLARYGCMIYQVLRQSEKSGFKSSGSADSVPEPSVSRTKSNGDITARVKKSESKITRILHLIVVASVLLVLTMFFQLLTVFTAASDKYDLNHPSQPPETGMDVLSDSIFNIIFWIVPLVGTHFFRYRPSPEEDRQESFSSRSSRNQRAPSQAEMMKQETRAKRASTRGDVV